MLMMNMWMTADNKCEDGNADTGMSVSKYMAKMLKRKMMTQVKMVIFVGYADDEYGDINADDDCEDDNGDAEEGKW